METLAIEKGVQHPTKQLTLQQLPTWVARRSHLLAIGLLGLALAYRVALVLQGWPPFDSDQAITGLVARHIWLNGEHPLFFWGEHYMGAFEAYFAVPFFTFFGASVASLHFSVLVLAISFLACMYAVGRAAYGPIVGLLVLAYLAFGPSVSVVRDLTSNGGYQEILLCGAVMMLGAWSRLREVRSLPTSRREWTQCVLVYALLGFSMGLAIWADFLILPTVLMTLGVLLVARPREVLSRAGLTLLVCALIALMPVLFYNVTHSFVSLHEGIAQGNGNAAAPALTLHEIRARLQATFTNTVPLVYGSPAECATNDIMGSIPFVTHPSAPGGTCDRLNQLLSLTVLAIYTLVTCQLALFLMHRLRSFTNALRGDLRRDSLLLRLAVLRNALEVTYTPSEADDSAKMWLRLIMLGGAVATLAAYVSESQSAAFPTNASRYLVPVYLSVPLLFGLPAQAIVRRIPAASLEPGTQALLQGAVRVISVATVSCFLILSAYGGWLIQSSLGDSSLYRWGEAMPSNDQALLTFMRQHHIHTYYAQDYWACFRLVFESQEQVVCAIALPGDPPPAQVTLSNRSQAYMDEVAHDPRHAYVEYAGVDEATRFKTAGLASRGYMRAVIGPYAVYYLTA